MAYGLSNGHVTDDVMWPPKVLWGSTVDYPSDSLASSLTTDKRLFTARDILGQRPYPLILLFLAHRDIVYWYYQLKW